MKYILIISTLTLFSFQTKAQETQKPEPFNYYNKGRKYIGFKLPQIGIGNFVEGRAPYYHIALDFQYGAFVKDKFMLGARQQLTFSNQRFYGKTTNFARYYFLKKKWSPFVEVGLEHNYGKNSNAVRYSSHYFLDAYAGLGVAYQASKVVGLELMYKFPGYRMHNTHGSTGFSPYEDYGKLEFRVNVQLNALQNSLRDKKDKKRAYDRNGE